MTNVSDTHITISPGHCHTSFVFHAKFSKSLCVNEHLWLQQANWPSDTVAVTPTSQTLRISLQKKVKQNLRKWKKIYATVRPWRAHTQASSERESAYYALLHVLCHECVYKVCTEPEQAKIGNIFTRSSSKQRLRDHHTHKPKCTQKKPVELILYTCVRENTRTIINVTWFGIGFSCFLARKIRVLFDRSAQARRKGCKFLHPNQSKTFAQRDWQSVQRNATTTARNPLCQDHRTVPSAFGSLMLGCLTGPNWKKTHHQNWLPCQLGAENRMLNQ